LAEYEWGFPRENTNRNDDNGDLAKSASLEMELPRENTRRFTMRKFELLTVGNAGNDENGDDNGMRLSMTRMTMGFCRLLSE